ncbi:hypothetical protein NM688_g5856 [Phlebia brevispora]|uniref:Uncharacterized protein n=1 Tax=Phlebia brevispora TaxID=194682 RepID=A0ACC1SNV1_9APHY|nr:hypothetical protein NM688_g5856 [Phlebia brevispora]
MIFKRLTLRNRDDADTLLGFLRCPASVISGYINTLELELSVTSYPYRPWIHTVCEVILRRLARKPHLELMIIGPLPSNKVMKGVHEMLPRSYPCFSSELRELCLDRIQFKSFGHLMGTIGEMPALTWVYLEKVTWDRSQDEEFRPPPARRARFQQQPKYAMRECTDDAAAVVFLQLLLICPGSDRVDELDADRLYRIISHVTRGRESVNYVRDKNLGPDTFMIIVQQLSYQPGYLHFHVFLTPHVEGQPRHIRAIASNSTEWLQFTHVDWTEVDNLVASLSALETLLLVFENEREVLPVHRDIIAQKMAHFRDSHKLKYALNFGSSFYRTCQWAQVACADDATITEIGPRYEGDYEWKQLV